MRADALIYIDGVPVINATIRNIGRDGAYVETRGPVLARGTAVDLELCLRLRGTERRHRLPALVVHIDTDGMGVMFRRLRRQDLNDIETLLHGNYAA
jgi:hypothetical protein